MTQHEKILVVDKEESVCIQVTEALAGDGFDVAWCIEGGRALSMAKETAYDLIISGFNLSDIDGLELQEKIKQLSPETGFMIMTSQGSLESAVKALKNGALDYLTKPINHDILTISVKQAFETWKLKKENKRIKREIKTRTQTRSLLGNSPQMIGVYRTVARIAESNANVLITGETGTGKELIARSLHLNSVRADYAFIALNCTSIPESLLESELFGHVKGAFTGAIATRKGLFEEAAGGTIFLDEIGDISLSMQAKLLRVIQEKEIRRVGDSKPSHVDVRVIAATNKELEKGVQEGSFREDLFYRLNVATVHMPPLRERKDDISLLSYHFMDMYAEEENTDVENISPEAMEILKAYRWPGNVRELESVIERAVIICKGSRLQPEDLPDRISRTALADAEATETLLLNMDFIKDSRVMSKDEVEKAYLIAVLAETKGDKSKAARIMGIGRRTLYRMLERYKIPGQNKSRP